MRRTTIYMGLWAGLVFLTLALYSLGLNGPFLFDDFGNLAPIDHWSEGSIPLWEAIFGNRSGPTGRPLAMGSFVLNAAIAGVSPWSYKAGNSLIHAAAGLAVGWLAFRLAMFERANVQRAAVFALLVAATWMLHSSQVTTVLYPVQRMAQLSMLLVTLGLVAFTAGLARWDAVPGRARILIFLVFPVLIGMGLLAKENAAVAPLMAGGIYIAFWGRDYSRAMWFRVLAAAAGLIALVAFVALAWVQPDSLFGAYGSREFSMSERLYTQIQALVDYAHLAIVPAGQGSGLFADDYPISRGLFAPPTTALALLLLVAITVAAFMMRGKTPLILAGWLMFLGGHAVESTILPLELYFEHRNYLPSVGLYIALYGAGSALVDYLVGRGAKLQTVVPWLAGFYLVLLAVSTGLRASAWGDELVLLAMTAEARPNSYRANAAAFDVALRRDSAVVARASVERMIASNDPRSHSLGYMHRIVLDCLTRGTGSINDLNDSVRSFPTFLTGSDMNAVQQLDAHVVGNCPSPPAAAIGAALEEIVARAQPKDQRYFPRPFFLALAGRAFSQAGLQDDAIRVSDAAWQEARNPEYGAMLALMLARDRQFSAAEQVIAEAGLLAEAHSQQAREAVKRATQEIDTLKQSAANPGAN